MIIFILFTTILCYRPIPQNQYIILSTSKFWFNYRQAINSLLIYQQLKEWRINDDQISLMIPEDTACNRKNNVPGVACAYDGQREPNIHKNVNWDFKRNDVNIKYWIDVMRNKYNKYTPQSRRITLSKEQKLLMFMNGHGGDGYTKMQDTTYLLDFEMEKITKEMEFLQLYQVAYLILSKQKNIFFFCLLKGLASKAQIYSIQLSLKSQHQTQQQILFNRCPLMNCIVIQNKQKIIISLLVILPQFMNKLLQNMLNSLALTLPFTIQQPKNPLVAIAPIQVVVLKGRQYCSVFSQFLASIVCLFANLSQKRYHQQK